MKNPITGAISKAKKAEAENAAGPQPAKEAATRSVNIASFLEATRKPINERVIQLHQTLLDLQAVAGFQEPGVPDVTDIYEDTTSPMLRAVIDLAKAAKNEGRSEVFVNSESYRTATRDASNAIIKLDELLNGNNQLLEEHKANQLEAKRREAEALKAKEREDKHGWVSVEVARGRKLWMPNTTLRLIKGLLPIGRHTLIVGPPGVAKTEVGRATKQIINAEMAEYGHDLYEMFQLDVTGLVDVSQMEFERYFSNEEGVMVSGGLPTQLIRALRHIEAGGRAILFIDEIARVGDPAILNPLLHLLEQGEYFSVMEQRTYRVRNDNFVLVATANDAEGYNFSGNNRRGLDDAFMDRVQVIALQNPPLNVIPHILKDICPPTLNQEVGDSLMQLYRATDKQADQRKIVNVRTLRLLAEGRLALGPQYSLKETIEYMLKPRTKDQTTLTAIIAMVESMGL